MRNALSATIPLLAKMQIGYENNYCIAHNMTDIGLLLIYFDDVTNLPLKVRLRIT